MCFVFCFFPFGSTPDDNIVKTADPAFDFEIEKLILIDFESPVMCVRYFALSCGFYV